MLIWWIIGGAVVIGLVILFIAAVTKDADKWKLAAEGTFDHVEYGRYHTAVYFDDGRTCLMRDWRSSMTHPRGSKLQIWRDGLGNYRIDKV